MSDNSCIEGETKKGTRYRARVSKDASPEALAAIEKVVDAAHGSLVATTLFNNPLRRWIDDTIHGTGGFDDYVEHELPVMDDRDFSLVAFVIRALANPECGGSEEVLRLIIEQRSGEAPRRAVFESRGGEFPGWCQHCGRRRTLHRNHPGQEDGDPEWCF